MAVFCALMTTPIARFASASEHRIGRTPWCCSDFQNGLANDCVHSAMMCSALWVREQLPQPFGCMYCAIRLGRVLRTL
eukprot:4114503-Prorocentrum_lima.AAC.1